MAKNTGRDRRRASPFTAKEDAQILAHKCSDAELSKKIGRSISAIWMRRSRLTRPD